MTAAFPLPEYSPELQERIDNEAARTCEWLEAMSPSTLEWMREDRYVVQLVRAAMSDVLNGNGSEEHTVRALGWIQFLVGLGA